MDTIDNRRIVYQAIFINPEDVLILIEKQGEKLPNNVKNMHCTFKYQPSEKEIENFSKILGKDIKLKVVGYYSDGKNSGYEIELPSELRPFYTNAKSVDNENSLPTVVLITPHVTASMIEGAKAVDTGKLPFSRENFEPFIIHGKAGYFTTIKKGKEIISEVIFDPVLKERKNTDKGEEEIK